MVTKEVTLSHVLNKPQPCIFLAFLHKTRLLSLLGDRSGFMAQGQSVMEFILSLLLKLFRI